MDILNQNESLLFKFSPINLNLIRTLVNSQIWGSAFNKLNDPFEGKFEIEEMKLPSEAILSSFYKDNKSYNYSSESISKRINKIKKSPSNFYKDLEADLRLKFLNRIKIACFSLIYNEILMWSHYANEHKGVCLLFDKKILINSDSLEKENFEIDYIDEKKVLYEKRDNLKINFEYDEVLQAEVENFDEIVFKKLDCWKYEKEYRILAMERSYKASDGININFNKNALCGVIFGEKCSFADIRLICSILTNYGYVDSKFIWGASKIVPSTGELVSIFENGFIDSEYLLMQRNQWLYYTYSEKNFL